MRLWRACLRARICKRVRVLAGNRYTKLPAACTIKCAYCSPIKIVLRKIVFRSLILAFLTRHNLRVYAPIALKFALHICLIVKINW